MPDSTPKTISKVIYGGKTLIDLTTDTVTADKILAKYTAHDKSGAVITGTCTYDAATADATAQDSEILATKTAYVAGSKVTGTMTNNGGVTGAISALDTPYSIPVGYHDGSGTVTIAEAEATKITPQNIRTGITILGVEGTMSTTEGLKPQQKTVTPSASVQTVVPDEGYNALSQVTVNAIPYEETENAAGGLTVTIAGQAA